jgi:hypothetical protein
VAALQTLPVFAVDVFIQVQVAQLAPGQALNQIMALPP